MTTKAHIDAIDLESVKYRLVRDENWTREYADQIEPMYKGYLLLLTMNPDHPLVPNKAVDTMWHTHIIDTEKYAADCQSAFGYFLHHIPSRKEESPVERSRLAAAFDQTASLFREVVGFNFVVSAPGTQDADQMAICQGKSCSGPTPNCFAGSPLKTQGNPADSFDQMAICQGKSCTGPTPECFAGAPALQGNSAASRRVTAASSLT